MDEQIEMDITLRATLVVTEPGRFVVLLGNSEIYLSQDELDSAEIKSMRSEPRIRVYESRK